MPHRARVASLEEVMKAIEGTIKENREAFKQLGEYDLNVNKEAAKVLANTRRQKK